MLVLDKPVLILDLEKGSYYLKEEMVGSGYFLTGGPQETSLMIDIYLEDGLLISTNTDNRGYFTFNVEVPLDSKLGPVNVSATVEFLEEQFVSTPILVLIERIPVKLQLFLNAQDLSPGDTLEIEGKVWDHYGDPLGSGPIDLDVAGSKMSLTSSREGTFFQDVDTVGMDYGDNHVRVVYPGNAYFQSAEASAIFRINIETFIQITVESAKVEVGEGLEVLGTFTTAEGEWPDGRELLIITDGGVRGTVTTVDGDIETEVSFRTEGMHTIVLAYVSQDPRLRNSTSNELFIEVNVPIEEGNPVIDYLPYLAGIIVAIVMLVVVAIFLLRHRGKRSRPGRKTGKGDKKASPVKTKKAEPPRPSESLVGSALEKVEMLDIRFMSTQQESVVVNYRLFLGHVIRRTGRDISSMTPNEIKRLAVDAGMPTRGVNDITNIFSKAFYSKTEVTTRDMKRMAGSVEDVLGGGRP
jgi:hypothetical protein